MIAQENNAKDRIERFTTLKNLISGISLLKDKVIPTGAIKKVIPQIQSLDFDFEYSHEVPFPLGNSSYTDQVNQAFDKVFNKAVAFFK